MNEILTNMVTKSYVLLFAIFLIFILLVFTLYFYKKQNESVIKSSVGNNGTNLLNIMTSAIIGVATVGIMLAQADIQKQMMKLQEAEHQPEFNLNCVENNVNYLLRHKSGLAKNMKIVYQQPYMRINYVDTKFFRNEIESYIPLQNPRRDLFEVNGLDVIRTIECTQYEDKKTDMVKQAGEYTRVHANVSYIEVDVIYLVIISYTDMYEKTRLIYTQGERFMSQNEYERIKRSSMDDYRRSYDLSELSIGVFLNNSVRLQKYKKGGK